MTIESFMKKMESCFITKEEYLRDLNKLFERGILTEESIAKMGDTFSLVYPIAAAIYERECGWFVSGNSTEKKNRQARRKCNYYKLFL